MVVEGCGMATVGSNLCDLKVNVLGLGKLKLIETIRQPWCC